MAANCACGRLSAWVGVAAPQSVLSLLFLPGLLSDLLAAARHPSLRPAARTFAKDLSQELEELHSGTSRGQHARNAIKMYTYLIHLVAMEQESAANASTRHLNADDADQVSR